MLAVTKHASVDKITEILSRNPAAIKSVNKFTKRLALHWACVYDSPFEIVKVLVEKYPKAIALADKEGMTPMHLICAGVTASGGPTQRTPETTLQVIHLFVQHAPPCALTVMNDNGYTPLHLACEFKCLSRDCVTVLIQTNPASVTIPTKNGLTPLDLACLKETKDWASPEDRSVILELLRATEKEVVEQEQERMAQEEKERIAREIEEKKRREEEERIAMEIAEQKRRGEEAEAKRRRIEHERIAKEVAEDQKRREAEEQKERERIARELLVVAEEAEKQNRSEKANSSRSSPAVPQQQQQQSSKDDFQGLHKLHRRSGRTINNKQQEGNSEIRAVSKEKKRKEIPWQRTDDDADAEEKKCEDNKPKPVQLRDQPNPDQVGECFHPVGLNPRLEPPLEPSPGLVFQQRRLLKAAQKESNSNHRHLLDAEAQSLLEEENALGNDRFPYFGKEEEGDSSSRAIDHSATAMLLNILKVRESPVTAAELPATDKEKKTAADSKSCKPRAHSKLLPKRALSREQQKDGDAGTPNVTKQTVDLEDQTAAAVQVTPESTAWQSEKQQQPSNLTSSTNDGANGIAIPPPGFNSPDDFGIWNHRKEATTSCINIPSIYSEPWEEGFFRSYTNDKISSATETKISSAFPTVNLQSLATSMGYGRLFDFDDGCANPPGKTLQELQGELLSHSEERTRLMKSQQEQWRKDMKNNAEQTPLHLACANSDPCAKTIQLLADSWPASLEQLNSNGQAPLHVACANNKISLNVIELLVEKFDEALNLTDKFGNTPLHVACQKSSPYEVIQYLVKKALEKNPK